MRLNILFKTIQYVIIRLGIGPPNRSTYSLHYVPVQKLPSPRQRGLGEVSCLWLFLTSVSARYSLGAYSCEESFRGKNTGGLLSKASTGDKKTKLPFCASLKWKNLLQVGRENLLSQQLPPCTYRLCTAQLQGRVQTDTPASLPDCHPLDVRDWGQWGRTIVK